MDRRPFPSLGLSGGGVGVFGFGIWLRGPCNGEGEPFIRRLVTLRGLVADSALLEKGQQLYDTAGCQTNEAGHYEAALFAGCPISRRAREDSFPYAGVFSQATLRTYGKRLLAVPYPYMPQVVMGCIGKGEGQVMLRAQEVLRDGCCFSRPSVHWLSGLYCGVQPATSFTGAGIHISYYISAQRFQTQHFPIRAIFLPLNFKSPVLFFWYELDPNLKLF